MSARVLIWDEEGLAPKTNGTTVYWRGNALADNVSVPRLLEDRADHFRAKYLTFIQDLGETEIAGKRVVDHLALGDGFSFWWMTLLTEKTPFRSPRIYSCLRLLALEEILLDLKPEVLCLASADRDLAEAVEALCLKLNVAFEWRRRPAPNWSARRLYDLLPHPAQGLVYMARHLIRRWSARRLRRPRWFSGEGAIFVCSFFDHLDGAACAAGKFFSHQWGPLPGMLYLNGRRTNWIQHLVSGPGTPDARTGRNWLRRFNADADRQGAHAFLDGYRTLGVVIHAVGRWAWLNLIGWRLRRIGHAARARGSATWLWPFLRDDWRASISGGTAVANCLWVELFDEALKDIPPQRKGLYLWENQAWERALLRAWRKHGHGEIVGYAHATVPFWHLYYFDDPRVFRSNSKNEMPTPDRFAVNGPAAKQSLMETGYPTERLVDVEALRYLGLAPSESDRSADPLRIRVLILGDTIADSMRNLLTMLGGAISKLPPDWKFVIKPHPRYHIELSDYQGLEKVNRTDEPLDRLLGEFDVALTGNGTSAAVDAYQSGLPVVIGLAGTDLNLSPLRGQPGARFVSTAEELANALRDSGRDATEKSHRTEFFFRDIQLPRWRTLLLQPQPVAEAVSPTRAGHF